MELTDIVGAIVLWIQPEATDSRLYILICNKGMSFIKFTTCRKWKGGVQNMIDWPLKKVDGSHFLSLKWGLICLVLFYYVACINGVFSTLVLTLVFKL